MVKKEHFIISAWFLLLILVIHHQGGRIATLESKYEATRKEFTSRLKDDAKHLEDLDQLIGKVDGLFNGFQAGHAQLNGLITLNLKADQADQEIEFLKNSFSRSLGIEGDKQVFIFRSNQKPPQIEDSYIVGNHALAADHNYALFPQVRVGIGHEGQIKRGLVKVKNLTEQIPPDAKILSAVLYMKMTQDADYSPINIDETIHLYEVKKDWNGIGSEVDGRPAKPGESSWLEPKTGEASWHTPGLWPDEEDVGKTILATVSQIHRSTADVWIKFYFNEEGIKYLKRIVQGESIYYGWLIKQQDEARVNSLVYFHSSESREIKSRPYLEVIYLRDAPP